MPVLHFFLVNSIIFYFIFIQIDDIYIHSTTRNIYIFYLQKSFIQVFTDNIRTLNRE